MQIAQVRKATVEDAAGIACVHVRSWQVAYRGHMPDEYLDSLDVEKRTGMWRELTQDPDKIIFVAEDKECKLVGFSVLGPSRDADANPSTAEIMAIYVHPEKWQKGIGRALLSASFDHIRKCAFEQVTLWYWKQIKEHALFTNRSDLPRTAPSRMTTTGKASPSARFVIVVKRSNKTFKIDRGSQLLVCPELRLNARSVARTLRRWYTTMSFYLLDIFGCLVVVVGARRQSSSWRSNKHVTV